MKHNLPSKNWGQLMPILSLGLMPLVALSQTSEGALTIRVLGAPSSSSAIVELSGELIMPEYTGSGTGSTALLVPNPNDPTDVLTFGFSTEGIESGTLSTPATMSSFLSIEEGPLMDNATVRYLDSSNNDSLIQSIMFVRELSFNRFGGFGLWNDDTSSGQLRIASGSLLDAGDKLSFAGSFDIILGNNETFETAFVTGTHVGDYNGNAINVIVEPIPEPTTALSLCLGLMALGLRRKR